MKKIIGTFFSVMVAISFSSAVLAANLAAPSTVKLAKQIILSEEEPAPVPEPAPAPEPAPEPEPK